MDTPNKPNATSDEIVSEMLVTGGRFAKQLALLWRAADPVNQARLKEAFRPEFDRYRKDAATLAHYQGLAREAELASRN